MRIRRVIEVRRWDEPHSTWRSGSMPSLSLRRPRTSHRPVEPMIGLLAGSGRFPILFAESARRQGLKVACVGIKYEAPPELRDLCATYTTIGVAKLGRMIRAFDRWGVGRIVMAGKVTKNVMYTPW